MTMNADTAVQLRSVIQTLQYTYYSDTRICKLTLTNLNSTEDKMGLGYGTKAVLYLLYESSWAGIRANKLANK